MTQHPISLIALLIRIGVRGFGQPCQELECCHIPGVELWSPDGPQLI